MKYILRLPCNLNGLVLERATAAWLFWDRTLQQQNTVSDSAVHDLFVFFLQFSFFLFFLFFFFFFFLKRGLVLPVSIQPAVHRHRQVTSPHPRLSHKIITSRWLWGRASLSPSRRYAYYWSWSAIFDIRKDNRTETGSPSMPGRKRHHWPWRVCRPFCLTRISNNIHSTFFAGNASPSGLQNARRPLI